MQKFIMSNAPAAELTPSGGVLYLCKLTDRTVVPPIPFKSLLAFENRKLEFRLRVFTIID